MYDARAPFAQRAGLADGSLFNMPRYVAGPFAPPACSPTPTRVRLCATDRGPCAEVESTSAGPLLAFGAGAIVGAIIGGLIVYAKTCPAA